jgi:phosphoribosylaminoimidazolecarboxamide formyltransferase/IMP cyclohydrolase
VAACPEVKILSTGGTYTAVQKILGASAGKHLVAGLGLHGQPEMQGGLVKDMDFKIYLGLLSETITTRTGKTLCARRPGRSTWRVVNLYPFQKTVAREGVTPEEARTNIDIGGPAWCGPRPRTICASSL